MDEYTRKSGMNDLIFAYEKIEKEISSIIFLEVNGFSYFENRGRMAKGKERDGDAKGRIGEGWQIEKDVKSINHQSPSANFLPIRLLSVSYRFSIRSFCYPLSVFNFGALLNIVLSRTWFTCCTP